MTYMIVYSSITGNTEIIAHAIKERLDEKYCAFYGKPGAIVKQDAELIFVGFWVSMGSCSEEIKRYLQSLENKKFFLFGTAGFGGSENYFQKILKEIKEHISESNTIVDSFMCQGKMPNSVLERYKKLREEQPKNSNILQMIHNYETALAHPDINDVKSAQLFVEKNLKERCSFLLT